MKRFVGSLLAAGLITAAFSGVTAYAVTLERDVVADSYTVSRTSGTTGDYAISMTDSSGSIAHISFSAEPTYQFQLMPDVTANRPYLLTVGTEGEAEAETLENITVYPTAEKLAVLADLNKAADVSAVQTILTQKADVLELNHHPIYYVDEQPLAAVSEEAELEAISAAVYADGDGYETLSDFYAAYYGAKGLVLLNRAQDDRAAADIGRLYADYLQFDALRGYALVRDCIDSVYPYFIGQNQLTSQKANEAFKSYAVLAAVAHTQNDQQVLDIFENYRDLITFDLSVWNASLKSQTAKKLIGRSFATMSELEEAVETAAAAVKTQTGSTTTNRGSGGGGSRTGLAATVAPEKVSGTVQSGVTYRDLNETHWAYETVQYLTENNVLNGDETGHFKPEAAVTRAEFAKMLAAGFGLYDESAACSFVDMPREHWAYHYVTALAERGVISGIDAEHFGGDQPISRQDAAVMLTRLSSVFSADAELSFSDSDSISDYAKEAVAALSSLNILNGYEDNSFCPQKNVTRAEAAAVLARSMKLYMGGTVE